MIIERSTLPNGVTLLTTPMPYLHSVTLIYYFRVGSRYERDNEAGLSHFIEHMLFRGTTRYPSTRALSEAIENLGGDHNGGTGKEMTDYSVKISSAHVAQAFDVLTDMVRAPLLLPADIEKERRIITEELNMYKDAPQDWVRVLLDGVLFPGSGLGREVVGTQETLAAFTREQVQRFFADYYTPSNLVVSVAGDITHATALGLLGEHIGDWKGTPAPSWEVYTPATDGPQIAIDQRSTEQVNLCIGFPALGHDDPDQEALSIINAILGDGMSSRLVQVIREDQGLAYDVSSSTSAYHRTGSFDIDVGCDAEHVDGVITTALTELRRMVDAPPPEAEVQRIKDFTRGRFVIGLEDTASVAAWWGSQQSLRGTTRTVEEILERIDAVTPADVQRVAQRIFRPEAVRLAAIGEVPQAEHFMPLLRW